METFFLFFRSFGTMQIFLLDKENEEVWKNLIPALERTFLEWLSENTLSSAFPGIFAAHCHLYGGLY
jgi:hypothetical protein